MTHRAISIVPALHAEDQLSTDALESEEKDNRYNAMKNNSLNRHTVKRTF
jgi:hypothetical protein